MLKTATPVSEYQLRRMLRMVACGHAFVQFVTGVGPVGEKVLVTE
jgi:hypothetical protein